MPDARLQRTRATLPEGYQFGDAAHPAWMPWKPSGLLAMSKAIDAAIIRAYADAPDTRLRDGGFVGAAARAFRSLTSDVDA